MVASPSVSERDKRWLKVLGTLNEGQARLFVAERALAEGRGGVSRLAQLTGMSRATITKGAAALQRRGRLTAPDPDRIRRPGGGRPRVEAVHPEIRKHLTRILEETTAGDPMSLLKWTNKSTRAIAAEVTHRGCPIHWSTIARCLHDLGYSLQANVKTVEGAQHPDRDAQFRYLNKQVKAFLRTGDPVVSVDTKKKERIGRFRNAGRTWRPRGQPSPVFTHDFPHLGIGKAIPYGTYDIGQDRAVVNVGLSHDTAEFAVESIRRWWRLMGKRSYPAATRLLISADAGGSNGNRLRAWKLHLQRLATDLNRPITVCHYPPGTSKWNKIEHRLFSFISMNWRGQPLVSYEAVVNLIGSTRTRSGLKVKAVLDTREYDTGQAVTPEQFSALRLTPHAFHPDWNYTLRP
jgi:transposase